MQFTIQEEIFTIELVVQEASTERERRVGRICHSQDEATSRISIINITNGLA